MICGSPRHSDWLLPFRRTAPVPPAMIAVPLTSSRSEEPCPRPEVLSDLWQLWRVYGVSSPRGESWVFWNGRAVLAALSFQSPLLRVGSASYGKGKDSTPRTSVQGALSSDTCRAADTAAAASPMEAGRSRSQNRALAAHATPRGRPRTKQDSTEKVERLRDNQRGLSVVIYNRDCKMVN